MASEAQIGRFSGQQDALGPRRKGEPADSPPKPAAARKHSDWRKVMDEEESGAMANPAALLTARTGPAHVVPGSTEGTKSKAATAVEATGGLSPKGSDVVAAEPAPVNSAPVNMTARQVSAPGPAAHPVPSLRLNYSQPLISGGAAGSSPERTAKAAPVASISVVSRPVASAPVPSTSSAPTGFEAAPAAPTPVAPAPVAMGFASSDLRRAGTATLDPPSPLRPVPASRPAHELPQQTKVPQSPAPVASNLAAVEGAAGQSISPMSERSTVTARQGVADAPRPAIQPPRQPDKTGAPAPLEIARPRSAAAPVDPSARREQSALPWDRLEPIVVRDGDQHPAPLAKTPPEPMAGDGRATGRVLPLPLEEAQARARPAGPATDPSPVQAAAIETDDQEHPAESGRLHGQSTSPGAWEAQVNLVARPGKGAEPPKQVGPLAAAPLESPGPAVEQTPESLTLPSVPTRHVAAVEASGASIRTAAESAVELQTQPPVQPADPAEGEGQEAVPAKHAGAQGAFLRLGGAVAHALQAVFSEAAALAEVAAPQPAAAAVPALSTPPAPGGPVGTQALPMDPALPEDPALPMVPALPEDPALPVMGAGTGQAQPLLVATPPDPATPDSPPPAPAPLARQVAVAVQQAGQSPIDIILQPEELGRIQLTLTPHPGGIKLTIAAERGATLGLMREHVAALGVDLKALGYGAVDYEFSPETLAKVAAPVGHVQGPLAVAGPGLAFADTASPGPNGGLGFSGAGAGGGQTPDQRAGPRGPVVETPRTELGNGMADAGPTPPPPIPLGRPSGGLDLRL